MDKLKEYLNRHRADLDVDSPASDAWVSIEAGLPAGSGSSRWIVRFAAAACVIALAGGGVWLVVKDKRVAVERVVRTEPVRPVGQVDTTGSVGRVQPTGRGERVAGAGSVAGAGQVDTAGQAGPDKRVAGAEQKGRVGRTGRTGGAGRMRREEPVDEVDAIDKSYSTLIDYQLKKLRATPLYAENGNYFSFYIQQFKEMDQDERQVRNDIKAYGLTSEFLEQLINVYQQKLNVLKNLEAEINKMNNKVREKAAPSAKTEVYYLNL